MLELDKDSYSKVAGLVGEVPFNSLFARVVLEKKVSGRVFVDDNLSPSVCLVVHKYGMALLCGDYRNDSFNSALRSFLKNDSLNKGSAKWMLCHPDEWEDVLRTLLGKDLVNAASSRGKGGSRKATARCVLKTERVNFRFDANPAFANLELPRGFGLKRVNLDIYDKITGSVIPRSFWDSAEDFLRSGVGFSLLNNGRVVSTCFSSFIVGSKLELGVETDPAYRNRGLSIHAGIEMIDYCLSKGFEPVWACSRDNTPSFKLALKLGFLPSTYHPYYIIPFD